MGSRVQVVQGVAFAIGLLVAWLNSLAVLNEVE